jgi:hypothetical protein
MAPSAPRLRALVVNALLVALLADSGETVVHQ